MSNKKLEKNFNVDNINNNFIHNLYIELSNYTENLSFIEKLSFKGFTSNPILNFIDKKYFKAILNFNSLPERNNNPDSDRSVPDTRENLTVLLKKNIVENFLINDMFEQLILNHEYADRKKFVNTFDKVPKEIMFFIIPLLKNKEGNMNNEFKELQERYNVLKEKKDIDSNLAIELKIKEFKLQNYREDLCLVIKKTLNKNPELLQNLQESFPEMFNEKEEIKLNKNKILLK